MCMYVDIPLVILAVTSRLTLQSFWMLNDTLSDRRPMVGSRNGAANRRPSAAPPQGRCNWVPTVPSDGDEEGNWSSEATCYPHYYIVCCQKIWIVAVLSHETCHLRLPPQKMGKTIQISDTPLEMPGLREGSLQVPHQQCQSAYPLGEGSPKHVA